MKKVIIVFLFAFLFTSDIYSQQEQWTRIPLPSEIKQVTAIAKDAHNALWVATSSYESILGPNIIGILADGSSSWKLITPKDSLIPNAYVFEMKLNRTDSSMWVATDSGLAIYDGVNWRRINSKNSSLPSDKIYSLEIDKCGNKWLGTSNGLVKITPKNEFTIFNMNNTSFKSNAIVRLKIDSKNHVWFITSSWRDQKSGGVFAGQLIEYNDTSFHYFELPDRDDHGPCMAISSQDSLWLGVHPHYLYHGDVGGSLSKLSNNRYISYDYPQTRNRYFHDMAFDKNNKLYYSEESSNDYWGLSSYYEGKFFHYSIYGSPIGNVVLFQVNVMYPDTSGSMYFAGSLTDVNSTTQALYICKPGVSAVNDGNASGTIKGFNLSQNYPNPFNPSTTISYSIAKQSHVELKVYDMLGREVTTLVNQLKNIGEYKVQFDASSLPSGVYVYTIQAREFRESKKLILLR